jgi:thioredoxin family protein
MATSTTSVVTPQRFATGLSSFKEWMAAIGQRQAEFQRHYDEFQLKAEDAAYFKKLVAEKGLKAFVIGEDWCPDVWRGVPVMAKVSEASGMELRYFMRDQNKDIMAEFLKNGEFESIPTVVFYDGNHNYLGHWIERAKLADEQMPAVRAKVMPATMPARDTPEYAALMDKSREANIAAAEPWRQAQIQEIRELLDKALK